jgi:outer membrane receptor protein involved in Fe transport
MASVPEAQFQNVGEVENSGWEFQGKIAFGKLDVLGTYSRTRSTVERLSPTYSGDLRVGDQVLEVPRHTAGASVIYSPFSGTRLVTRMIHIGGWTGTDFMTLFGVFYGTEPFRGSVRDYWIEYPSVTKFNASLTQTLTSRLTGFLHVDNVGNNTRFEQSNVMIPLGRLTTVGMQLTY